MRSNAPGAMERTRTEQTAAQALHGIIAYTAVRRTTWLPSFARDLLVDACLRSICRLSAMLWLHQARGTSRGLQWNPGKSSFARSTGSHILSFGLPCIKL